MPQNSANCQILFQLLSFRFHIHVCSRTSQYCILPDVRLHENSISDKNLEETASNLTKYLEVCLYVAGLQETLGVGVYLYEKTWRYTISILLMRVIVSL